MDNLERMDSSLSKLQLEQVQEEIQREHEEVVGLLQAFDNLLWKRVRKLDERQVEVDNQFSDILKSIADIYPRLACLEEKDLHVEERLCLLEKSCSTELEKLSSRLSLMEKLVSPIRERLDLLEEANGDLFFGSPVASPRCRAEVSLLGRALPKSTTSVAREMQNRRFRERNIMLFGTVAGKNGVDRSDVDGLLDQIGCLGVEIASVMPIGNGPCALRLSLSSAEDKNKILAAAFMLRRSRNFARVFMRDDLTPFQREQERVIRQSFGRNISKLLWRDDSLYPVNS